jgi:hypothetical protein
MVVAIGGIAVAATSPQVLPDPASVGREVTFLNGCLGVVDDAPVELRVALVHGNAQPDDASVARTTATLVDPWTYTFRIPDLEPGRYLVFLECAAGDWRTNLAEPGGAAALTVLASPAVPRTDAVPVAPPGGPGAPSVAPAFLLAAAVVGGILALCRTGGPQRSAAPGPADV